MINGAHKLMDSSGPRFNNGNGNGPTSSNGTKTPPIASLCNLGNTCFLNSVLYTLRFTPGFLHSLHHMVHDVGLLGGGGSGSAVAAAAAAAASNTSCSSSSSNSCNSYSNGNKKQRNHYQQQQILQLNNDNNSEMEITFEVIEELHDLFKSLNTADIREPIPPSNFLQAVGRLNPMFEGNHQQDAHELLVTILNMLQDIKIPANPSQINGGINGYDHPIDKKSSVQQQPRNNSNSSNNGKVGNGRRLFSKSSSSTSSVPPAPQNPPPIPIPPPIPQITENGIMEILPNFVKENFVGKSVMRTRCLECEMSTYQSETFANIDIPLHFDDEDDDLSGKDLFLKQIMASETLRENNKYWCEECSRLNEAQRSVRFELLPKVMVLQLKRFTATGSKANMSKINDYIPTPFTMSCFCTQCYSSEEPKEPKHHYRLYAIIMHLGATLASGHYIAYVRVIDQTLEYSLCTRGNNVNNTNTTTTAPSSGNKPNGGKSKGIMKYFSRSNDTNPRTLNHSSSTSNSNLNSNSSSSTNLSNTNSLPSSSSVSNNYCRSSQCCGLKGLNNVMMTAASDSASAASTAAPIDSTIDSAACVPEDYWLECDDENIAVISRKKFEDILSSKQGQTTPYLLFYQKI